eukprot:8164865-Alexandrium_andersonii.AAC.1
MTDDSSQTIKCPSVSCTLLAEGTADIPNLQFRTYNSSQKEEGYHPSHPGLAAAVSKALQTR